MKKVHIAKANAFDLVCDTIASDKSISHRCAMFSLLSDKPSRIKNYLKAEDTLNTLQIVESLGAKIEWVSENELIITPQDKLYEANDVLDCGNSGTAIRLFCGFLSSAQGHFVLTGDKYLRKRPMKRVVEPLRSIGAQIDGRNNGDLAPLSIRGKKLQAFDYESKIASAQVKSALILAALKAEGACSFSEPELSRDHTERMLQGMGANLKVEDKIYVEPMTKPLEPLDITVPTDPSSAFFFAVAAAIVEGAQVLIKNVTLNKTRIESYKVLEKMGAKVEYIQKQNVYEPIGDIKVSYNGKLNAVVVEENISWLIDELPALSIAMSVAQGQSFVKNAHELRVKESDRISTVVTGLQRCGVSVEEFEDGYGITGGSLQSATVDSHGDHRIAMSFCIGGLLCSMEVNDIECIDTSFPNFFEILSQITEYQTS
jgi:3-phosphoshikimate 1-carboxyvinyltransferase